MDLSFVQSRPEAEGGLVDGAMRAINQHIRSERLRAGDPVPSEARLAAELGVSRTAVREAFRSLSALGILQLVNGRRARVGATDADVLGLVLDHAVHTDQASIQQIYDVRRTIEVRTAALAALRRTEGRRAPSAPARPRCARPFIARTRSWSMTSPFTPRSPTRHAIRCSRSSSDRFNVITRQTWRIGWESRATDDERMANVACHERIAEAIEAQNPRPPSRRWRSISTIRSGRSFRRG